MLECTVHQNLHATKGRETIFFKIGRTKEEVLRIPQKSQKLSKKHTKNVNVHSKWQ